MACIQGKQQYVKAIAGLIDPRAGKLDPGVARYINELKGLTGELTPAEVIRKNKLKEGLRRTLSYKLSGSFVDKFEAIKTMNEYISKYSYGSLPPIYDYVKTLEKLNENQLLDLGLTEKEVGFLNNFSTYKATVEYEFIIDQKKTVGNLFENKKEYEEFLLTKPSYSDYNQTLSERFNKTVEERLSKRISGGETEGAIKTQKQIVVREILENLYGNGKSDDMFINYLIERGDIDSFNNIQLYKYLNSGTAQWSKVVDKIKNFKSIGPGYDVPTQYKFFTLSPEEKVIRLDEYLSGVVRTKGGELFEVFDDDTVYAIVSATDFEGLTRRASDLSVKAELYKLEKYPEGVTITEAKIIANDTLNGAENVLNLDTGNIRRILGVSDDMMREAFGDIFKNKIGGYDFEEAVRGFLKEITQGVDMNKPTSRASVMKNWRNGIDAFKKQVSEGIRNQPNYHFSDIVLSAVTGKDVNLQGKRVIFIDNRVVANGTPDQKEVELYDLLKESNSFNIGTKVNDVRVTYDRNEIKNIVDGNPGAVVIIAKGDRNLSGVLYPSDGRGFSVSNGELVYQAINEDIAKKDLGQVMVEYSSVMKDQDKAKDLTESVLRFKYNLSQNEIDNLVKSINYSDYYQWDKLKKAVEVSKKLDGKYNMWIRPYDEIKRIEGIKETQQFKQKIYNHFTNLGLQSTRNIADVKLKTSELVNWLYGDASKEYNILEAFGFTPYRTQPYREDYLYESIVSMSKYRIDPFTPGLEDFLSLINQSEELKPIIDDLNEYKIYAGDALLSAEKRKEFMEDFSQKIFGRLQGLGLNKKNISGFISHWAEANKIPIPKTELDFVSKVMYGLDASIQHYLPIATTIKQQGVPQRFVDNINAGFSEDFFLKYSDGETENIQSQIDALEAQKAENLGGDTKELDKQIASLKDKIGTTELDAKKKFAVMKVKIDGLKTKEVNEAKKIKNKEARAVKLVEVREKYKSIVKNLKLEVLKDVGKKSDSTKDVMRVSANTRNMSIVGFMDEFTGIEEAISKETLQSFVDYSGNKISSDISGLLAKNDEFSNYIKQYKLDFNRELKKLYDKKDFDGIKVLLDKRNVDISSKLTESRKTFGNLFSNIKSKDAFIKNTDQNEIFGLPFSEKVSDETSYQIFKQNDKMFETIETNASKITDRLKAKSELTTDNIFLGKGNETNGLYNNGYTHVVIDGKVVRLSIEDAIEGYLSKIEGIDEIDKIKAETKGIDRETITLTRKQKILSQVLLSKIGNEKLALAKSYQDYIAKKIGGLGLDKFLDEYRLQEYTFGGVSYRLPELLKEKFMELYSNDLQIFDKLRKTLKGVSDIIKEGPINFKQAEQLLEKNGIIPKDEYIDLLMKYNTYRDVMSKVGGMSVNALGEANINKFLGNLDGIDNIEKRALREVNDVFINGISYKSIQTPNNVPFEDFLSFTATRRIDTGLLDEVNPHSDIDLDRINNAC